MPPDDVRTLTVEEILRVLWRTLPFVTVLTVCVHLLIWGWPSLSPGDWISGSLWMMLAYLVAVIVHELLHVIPMILAGVRPSELRFGVRWREGVVYVHGGRPVTARAYRVILATPGVVLGIIPAIFGIATGNGYLTVFAWLMLVSAVGDWAILRLIRDLRPETMVQDHPTAVGCVVHPPTAPPETAS